MSYKIIVLERSRSPRDVAHSKFYGFKWRDLMPASTDEFDVRVSWDQVSSPMQQGLYGHA
jgi:hypothetical protein